MGKNGVMGKRKVNKKKGKKRGKQNSLGRERSRGLGSEVVEMESVGAQEQRVRDTTQIIEEILEKPQVRMCMCRYFKIWGWWCKCSDEGLICSVEIGMP